MQIQQSVQGLKQLSRELIAELLRLEEYGYPLPRSIFVCGATREVTTMATEAINQELASREGIKASVRSGCMPRFISEGEYCIDIGYFFSAHSRTPPLLKSYSNGMLNLRYPMQGKRPALRNS
jgi:hypothetical protein